MVFGVSPKTIYFLFFLLSRVYDSQFFSGNTIVFCILCRCLMSDIKYFLLFTVYCYMSDFPTQCKTKFSNAKNNWTRVLCKRLFWINLELKTNLGLQHCPFLNRKSSFRKCCFKRYTLKKQFLMVRYIAVDSAMPTTQNNDITYQCITQQICHYDPVPRLHKNVNRIFYIYCMRRFCDSDVAWSTVF